ncbi:hypothetical protein OAG82_03775 [Rubripirellula sp.]|nr:hypothetical protein [Rubripirellula sp.]MDB4621956.1 hypothetical protein [Rubripirellula sp.]
MSVISCDSSPYPIVNLPAGINLNLIPREFADSGSSTGVGLLVVAGVELGIGVLGSTEGGGDGGDCRRIFGRNGWRGLRTITSANTQTTIDLKGCMLAALFRDWLTAPRLTKTPRLGVERQGRAEIGRALFAAKTGQVNGNFAEILLLAGYFSSKI